MNTIILIVLFVCGQPDTIIVKYPESTAKYTHHVDSPETINLLQKILLKKPIIIQYEEDRGRCA